MEILFTSRPIFRHYTFLVALLFALCLTVAPALTETSARHWTTGSFVVARTQDIPNPVTPGDNPPGEATDQYPDPSNSQPLHLLAELRRVAERWERLALWLPLLLVTPGWLLAWVVGSGSSRPVTPLVAGLSLSLAPLIYVWSSLVGLRLYEPLIHSLFQASALALALWTLRNLERLKAAWQHKYISAFSALALFLLTGIATWLLAARPFLAPPGTKTLETGLLAQTLVQDGLITRLHEALPPAALAAILNQMGSYPIPSMLLLVTLILSISLVPTLYGLATEVTDRPWAALWVIPVVWLWPATWRAVASGEVVALYSMALLPVAIALGLRALRVENRSKRDAILAAFPLAALALVQGAAALGAWLLTLALWYIDRNLARKRERTDGGEVSHTTALSSSVLWLGTACVLLIPAWLKGQSLFPFTTAGYSLLLTTLLVSVVATRIVPTPLSARIAGVALIVISLPLLVWGKSRPLEARGVLVTRSEIETMSWVDDQTDHDALFLINVDVKNNSVHPVDGGFWLPLYGGRRTVLQETIDPALLDRAMAPGALADLDLRRELLNAGITHIFLGEPSGTLYADELVGQDWLDLSYQSGSVYVFNLRPTSNAGGLTR